MNSNTTKDIDKFDEFGMEILNIKALYVLQKQRLRNHFDGDCLVGDPYKYGEFQEFMKTSAKYMMYTDILLNNHKNLHALYMKQRVEEKERKAKEKRTKRQSLSMKHSSVELEERKIDCTTDDDDKLTGVTNHISTSTSTSTIIDEHTHPDTAVTDTCKEKCMGNVDGEILNNSERDANMYQDMMHYVMKEYKHNYVDFDKYMSMHEHISNQMYDHLMESFRSMRKSMDNLVKDTFDT